MVMFLVKENRIDNLIYCFGQGCLPEPVCQSKSSPICGNKSSSRYFNPCIVLSIQYKSHKHTKGVSNDKNP